MKNQQDLLSILKELDIPKYRLNQLTEAICQQGISDYQQINVLPKDLRTTLAEKLPILSIKPILTAKSKLHTTEKVLFETADGLRIESVMMRYQDGRNSICVSSQAGCQMGCKFCATGTMKFGRNLTYEEIFDQVLYYSQQLHKEKLSVSNVIYMGMGEPFMNYENVIKSANLLNDSHYLNIGARKITISTSGLVDGIDKLAEQPLQFNLAVSLHSPNQELREKLMPVAKKWKLDQLITSINNYIEKTHRRVSFEYVMLKDLNDSAEIAEELADLCQNQLIHINLIPYNNTNIAGISGTAKQKIYDFQKILQNNGINATVRTTMGEDISAACGQLANKN